MISGMLEQCLQRNLGPVLSQIQDLRAATQQLQESTATRASQAEALAAARHAEAIRLQTQAAETLEQQVPNPLYTKAYRHYGLV
jgi:hypothetical protein